MTGINTQGNTPARKLLDISDEYWKERARKEDQMNRGAPEDPDAPKYNESSRSTTRALSSAPQTTQTLEFLKALQNLSKATLELTTEPSNKPGARKAIINLDNKSVTIEFTYETNSGIKYLKWGDKEIINVNSKVEVNEKNNFDISQFIGGLITAYTYASDIKKPMNFFELQQLQERKLEEFMVKMFGKPRRTLIDRSQGGINKRHRCF